MFLIVLEHFEVTGAKDREKNEHLGNALRKVIITMDSGKLKPKRKEEINKL